ncbi:hypothetical protein EI427_13050 [Flammeovirga pectinis]|uniref:Uncharacterized protein n=1 Tax=Flammeovirga pectinis TaxID=2494373 RepID=A0A3S9P4W7_9BACT|nr:hypothetical protein [Flammeovirga pectinis]AZQ63132.1 hypothetical protein EI427_13050 [Flammeovirga pectinis]
MSEKVEKTNEIRERLKADKERLKAETKLYKDELVSLTSETVADTRHDIKKVLTYGAAVVATYSLSQWALRLHSHRSKKKYLKKLEKLDEKGAKAKIDTNEESSNSRIPSFGKMLRDEATVFLMGVAKEELLNYLTRRQENRKKKRTS